MLKCCVMEISILHLQTILSKLYIHLFNFVFNSHNFVIFIVIYSFQEGQVNHYVCMLYKVYIILVGISLIFIDRLEEENKNSTTGAQNHHIWSPHKMFFFMKRTQIVCPLAAAKYVCLEGTEQNSTIYYYVFRRDKSTILYVSILNLSSVCLSYV